MQWIGSACFVITPRHPQMEVSVAWLKPAHDAFCGGNAPSVIFSRPSLLSRLLLSFARKYACSAVPSQLSTVAAPRCAAARPWPG